MSKNEYENAEVYNGTDRAIINKDGGLTFEEELLNQGRALVKSNLGFQQVMKVQKPRDIDAVVTAIIKEAKFAKKTFYYNWSTNNKDGSKGKVEGGSIGLAMSIARNLQNNAIVTDVTEDRSHYIFTATFIDLENNFAVQRSFRQSKRANAGATAKMVNERAEDIAFQIGQSKAIRNSVLSGVPKWLIAKAIEEAKLAERDKISQEDIEDGKATAIKEFKAIGVTEEMLVVKYGAKSLWTYDDLVAMSGLLNALDDKVTSIQNEFDMPERETVGDTKQTAKEKLESLKKPKVIEPSREESE